jgi:hypothetical protein
MKVNVLKKKSGKIIATFEAKSTSDIKLEPQVSKGQTVEEMEMPEDYVSQLDTIYKKKPKGKKRKKPTDNQSST